MKYYSHESELTASFIKDNEEGLINHLTRHVDSPDKSFGTLSELPENDLKDITEAQFETAKLGFINDLSGI